MNTISTSMQRSTFSHNLLALASLLLVVVALLGINERAGISDGAMFWGLFFVGMVICATGPLGRGASYGWWNPLHIAGYLLGAVLLLLAAVVFFNVGPAWLANPQTGILILAALMAVKGVLALFYRQPDATIGTG